MSTSRNLAFNVQTAIDYGVDEAILIQNFVFWIDKNIANKKHYHDGRTWTYNTQEAFTFLFAFWSRRQIQRILESLEKQGVIVRGNYNLTAYDRTQWYAFKDEEKWLNYHKETPQTLEDVHVAKSQNGKPPLVQSKARNDSIQSTKPFNGKHEPVQPIPNNYTNKKTNNNNNPPDPQPAAPITLPLVGLTEHQKEIVSEQLTQLSPEQQNIAVQSFNRTVSSGKVESTPMALISGLIKKGLRNELEPIKATQTAQAMQSPETVENKQKARLEIIKHYVTTKKADLLKEFERTRAVLIKGVGVVYPDDLKLAGLFD